MDQIRNLQERRIKMEECLNSIRDIHDAILKSPSVNSSIFYDLIHLWAGTGIEKGAEVPGNFWGRPLFNPWAGTYHPTHQG
jgi:hypothetical protein